MKSIFRSATFLVGLLLTVGAFVAFFILGNILNPPPYQVIVVVRDVVPGTTLTKDLVTTNAQSLSPRVASGYVMADNLDLYMGATIIEPMHPGDPLTKSRLAKDGNPAAARRAALGLDDPAKTLMVVPVDDKTAPDNIAHGDRVDLIYTVGREPTSNNETGLNPYSQYSGGTQAGGTAAGEQESDEDVTLPLAKLVFKNLKIARAHREKQPNPQYTGAEGESPYIEGNINGLEVVVDREQEELLGWAIQHGKVRVALVSPNASPEDTSVATMGMTWDDLVEWFRMNRAGGLAILSGQPAPTIPPAAGAASVVRATEQARVVSALGGQPTAAPTPAGTSATPGAGAPVVPVPAATAAAAATAPAAATVPRPTTQPPAAAAPTSAPTQENPAAGTSPSMLASGVSLCVCGSIILLALVAGFVVLRRRVQSGGPARM